MKAKKEKKGALTAGVDASVLALNESAEMADQSFRKTKSKNKKTKSKLSETKTPSNDDVQKETMEFRKGSKGNTNQNELDTKINDDGKEEEKVEEQPTPGWSVSERMDHSETTGAHGSKILASSAIPTANTSDGGSHGSASVVSSKAPLPETQNPEEALKVPDAAPSPDPSRPENGGGILSRKNMFIGMLTFVVILLAIVLVVVINKNDSSSPSPNSSSSVPTQNEENDTCTDATCGYLIGMLKPSHPEQTWEKISIEATCQNSALHWLSQTQDILSIDPAMVRHRYALAMMYCELVTVENTKRLLQSAQKESWTANVVFGRPTEACFGDSNLGPSAFNPNCQSGVVNLDGQMQQLSGTLAPELSMADSLREITIKNGLVKGSIPKEYGRFQLLVMLDLSNNDLSGLIPSAIVTSSLQILLLNGNNFHGNFTIDVDNAKSLTVISISDNSLSGDFSDVCTLVDGGSLSLFAADVNEVGCECCTPSLPPDILKSTLTSAPITATPSGVGHTLKPSTASPTISPSTGEPGSPLTSPPTIMSLATVTPGPTDLPTSEPSPRMSTVPSTAPSLATKLPGSTNTLIPVDPPVEPSIPSSFTMSRPYIGIITTTMDTYIPDDCYFEDNIHKLPHISNQCECFGSITIIPEDVANLYNSIRDNIANTLYNGEYGSPANACDSANKALFWLSTGNTRDAGDLYQRFILALTFFATNGTAWDNPSLWLSDESECLYLGIQCSGSFQVDSIAIDTNNLFGSIPSEIRHLDGLRTLSLARNHLSGTIPPEVFTMKSIEIIQLYANNLVGSLPSEIGSASNLRILQLENNMLFGAITTEIGFISNLEKLNIGFNEFSRAIPTESKFI